MLLCADFWGPASNFGIPIAAVMDTQKDPEMYVVLPRSWALDLRRLVVLRNSNDRAVRLTATATVSPAP